MEIREAILAMERAALDRWGKGDPGGYEEISAESVTYFNPFVEQRLVAHRVLPRKAESQ